MRDIGRISFELGGSDCLLLQLVNAQPKLWIGFVYRRPLTRVTRAQEDEDADRFFRGLADIATAARDHGAGLILIGDYNVHSVRTPRHEQQHQFLRQNPALVEGNHPLSEMCESFIEGERTDAHQFHVLHGEDWTREPHSSEQYGCRRQLDYAIGDDRALSMTRHGFVADTLYSAYRHVRTDHPPVCLELHLAHLECALAPNVRQHCEYRRIVRWQNAAQSAKDGYRATLDAAAQQSLLHAKLLAGLAEDKPSKYVGDSVEHALTAILRMIKQTKEAHLQVSQADSTRVTTPTRARWWDPSLDNLHQREKQCRHDVAYLNDCAARGIAVNPDRRAAASAALAAAKDTFEEACLEAQLFLAADTTLFDGPDVHESKRLHAMFKHLARGGGRAPTHIFHAIHDEMKNIITGDDVGPALQRWMRKFHRVDPASEEYDRAEYAAREREFAHWQSHLAAEECRWSRARADDSAYWSDFETTIDSFLASDSWDSAMFSDLTWTEYVVHNVSLQEVDDALRAGKHTAASPADQVEFSALKEAGPAFRLILAAFFTNILATGEVPVSWTEGWVSFLYKKGCILDAQSFRGIVVTSILTKTLERILLVRILRWLRFRRHIPLEQATTQKHHDVLSQVGMLLDTAALRDSDNETTHLMTVDIKSAYASVNRLFLWTQLRRMGLGGAALRFLVKLLGANAVRLGGLVSKRYTPRTERDSGVPEGYVLCVMLFAVFFSPLADYLSAQGLGVALRQQLMITSTLFIDDVALIAATSENVKGLFRALLQWCWKHRLRVHPGKCEYIVLGRGAAREAAQMGNRLVVYFQATPDKEVMRFEFPVAEVVRYLGWLVTRDYSSNETLKLAQKRAEGVRRGYRESWHYLKCLPRAKLLQILCAHVRSTIDWSAPIWPRYQCATIINDLASDDADGLRRVLALPGVPFPATAGVAFLLCHLTFQMNMLRKTARYAYRLAALLKADARRLAVVHGIHQRRHTTQRAAYERASCRNVFDALNELSLPLPDPQALSRGQWNALVGLSINRAVAGELRRHQSLAFLVMVNPSRAWRKRWILARKPGDLTSELLAGILLDRWSLVPDVRAQSAGPAVTGFCDLCGGQHVGSDQAKVLLECPVLAVPRADWYSRGRAVALAAGMTSWWQSHVEAAPAVPTTLAAAIFGRGAPKPHPRVADLADELTSAFVDAFVPWMEQHAAVLDLYRYRGQR